MNLALAVALMVSATVGKTSANPVTYTSCGVSHTLTQSPTKVVTMNQGVTEFMLAMGLADRMVGTAFIDDEIWPRYAADYSRIPVLSSTYPDEATIMGVNPDFILGSYKSAFRERTCEDDNCRGIYSDASGVGPCDGEGSDFFASGSNANTSYSTCRPQLHARGIGTWLEPVSCEDSTLKPQGGATEETVYAAIRQIGDIFNERAVAEQLVSEIRNDFDIAEQFVLSLGTTLKTVWLDCVDCCDDDSGNRGLFVGAGTGAPNLIMKEAGMSNVFADVEGSWACVNASTILDLNPDVMVVVDAAWDTAISKIDFLHNHTEFCTTDFVQFADYITIPFSASTLGPRNGVAALDMVSAALHVTTGSMTLNFKSGVKFLDPEELETQTAGLLCPFDASKKRNPSEASTPEASTPAPSSGSDGDDGLNDGVVAGIVVLVAAVTLCLAFMAYLVARERRGTPLFMPLLDNPLADDYSGDAKQVTMVGRRNGNV